MKIIVTHSSPDMDAITSVWLIQKFLGGWENSIVKFVPAGERIGNGKCPPASEFARRRSRAGKMENGKSPIEKVGEDEIIHVDTGLGPLDHHQTASDNVCGASLTWDFVKIQNPEFRIQNDKIKSRVEAINRMIEVVVDIDHFKEVFRKDPMADYHEFDLAGILDGLKLQFPNKDDYYVEFVSKCLSAVLHEFENRIWAEREIKENGIKFETREGIGMGFETINDSVVKLAQKMGFVIAVRKDPRKGYVRIKALPKSERMNIDLTLAYEKLRKMDPNATWFLHISKKMLLNGSVKNPRMRPTKLGLNDIIRVLKTI